MTAFALLSADETDLSVQTEHAKTALAEKLDALSIVTAYSHALINVVINPATTPPEPWFTTLNENLGTAKQHAQTWLTDIAPKVGSVIPQSIINYNNTFNLAAEEILRILDGKKVLSSDDKRNIIDLIEATLGVLEEQQSAVTSVQNKIVTLSDHFQEDHERLVSGENGAARAVQLAEADQVRIGTKIEELQSSLAAARMKVTASGIGLGLAIFVAVAAFALAVATGGAGLIVAGAVGVVGIGAAATTTGVYSAEVSSLIREIAEEQQRFENNKRQVLALKGLLGTVESLRQHNESAKSALTTVQTMWANLENKLNAVLTNLKGHKIDDSTVLQRLNLNAARKAWKDTADFAQQTQSLASGTKTQPPLQHLSLVRAFG